MVSDFNSDDSEQQQQQPKSVVQQDGPQYGMLTRYLESLNARTNRSACDLICIHGSTERWYPGCVNAAD